MFASYEFFENFKEQFVEEVHGSGVLVYLSATWLSELYQQVLACNLLEKCGYNPSSTENNALVNVLTGMRRQKLIYFDKTDIIRLLKNFFFN